MSLISAFTFFITVFLFSITPGPGVMALLAKALSKGARSCFFLALGMTCSDIVYLVLACYGLAAVAQHWEVGFTIIRLLGSAYLFYLGWRMWHSPVQEPGEKEQERQTGRAMSFMSGFMISASNPKVVLFYIAFLPTFIDVTQLNKQGILLVTFLTLIALMSGLMLIAFGAASARRLLKSSKSVRRLNRLSGSIMIGAGSFLVIKG